MPEYDSIRPGQTWLDTSGNHIQAHGGSIIAEDGTYYWYGENKEHSTPGSGIWTWGIRCYSSIDLCNWTDRGLIIPPSDDPQAPMHPPHMIERPHIAHNPRTGKYVCWIKIMDPGESQRWTVFTAGSLLGPYEVIRTGVRPLGMDAGDFDLVVDPSDSKGYFYFERVHSELICADLTDDYTAVTGFYSTHFPRRHPPMVREAPAHFRRNGKHYLITSGTSWYYPNPLRGRDRGHLPRAVHRPREPPPRRHERYLVPLADQLRFPAPGQARPLHRTRRPMAPGGFRSGSQIRRNSSARTTVRGRPGSPFRRSTCRRPTPRSPATSGFRSGSTGTCQ